VVFFGMGSAVVSVVQGPPSEPKGARPVPEEIGTVAPILLCLAAVLLLGVYLPPPLQDMIQVAAANLGGTP
jgi:hypothetical protein